jgi:uncharacterized protein YhdP
MCASTAATRRNATGTRFELKSREVSGDFEWDGAGGGKLTGRIGKFAIPEAAATPAALQAKASEVMDSFPALDITVDQLSFKDRQLGTVRIAAENKDGYWSTRVDAKNEDGTLESTGRWRLSTTQPDTRIEFKLSAKSIEKFLARAGYPDTVRRGSANVTGNLSWNGDAVHRRLSDARRATSRSMRRTASSSSSNPASAACWACSACNPCRAASHWIFATSSARALPSTASPVSLP